MVVFDDVAQDVKVRLYDSSVTPIRKSPDSFAEWAFDVRAGDIVVPRLDWTEPLRAELDHFLACVRGEAECLVPGSEGTAVTRTILAAQESLRRGGALVDIQG
jgi:predicted dehydrogenase